MMLRRSELDPLEEAKQLFDALPEIMKLGKMFEEYKLYKRGRSEMRRSYDAIDRVLIHVMNPDGPDPPLKPRYDVETMGYTLAYYVKQTGALPFRAGYLLPELENHELEDVADAIEGELEEFEDGGRVFFRRGDTPVLLASGDYLVGLLEELPDLWKKIVDARNLENRDGPIFGLDPQEIQRNRHSVSIESTNQLIVILSQRFGGEIKSCNHDDLQRFTMSLVNAQIEI